MHTVNDKSTYGRQKQKTQAKKKKNKDFVPKELFTKYTIFSKYSTCQASLKGEDANILSHSKDYGKLCEKNTQENSEKDNVL